MVPAFFLDGMARLSHNTHPHLSRPRGLRLLEIREGGSSEEEQGWEREEGVAGPTRGVLGHAESLWHWTPSVAHSWFYFAFLCLIYFLTTFPK